MKILAIDLGTKCGIANNFNGTIEAKTEFLATSTEVTAWGKQRLTRRCDPRFGRLVAVLSKYRDADVVVFEDVQFTSYTLQCQLWSALRTAIWSVFGGTRTHIDCVNVSTLKVFGANHGAATKEMMAASLFKQHPEFKNLNLDDNGIDAIWLLLWAKHNLGRMKPR